jgi:hypothetical protein
MVGGRGVTCLMALMPRWSSGTSESHTGGWERGGRMLEPMLWVWQLVSVASLFAAMCGYIWSLLRPDVGTQGTCGDASLCLFEKLLAHNPAANSVSGRACGHMNVHLHTCSMRPGLPDPILLPKEATQQYADLLALRNDMASGAGAGIVWFHVQCVWAVAVWKHLAASNG